MPGTELEKNTRERAAELHVVEVDHLSAHRNGTTHSPRGSFAASLDLTSSKALSNQAHLYLCSALVR